MCENKTTIDLTFRGASLGDQDGILAIGVMFDGHDYLHHYIQHYLTHPNIVSFVALYQSIIVSTHLLLEGSRTW